MWFRRLFLQTLGLCIFLFVAFTFVSCGGSSSNNNPQTGSNNPGSPPSGGSGSTGSGTGTTSGGTTTSGTTTTGGTTTGGTTTGGTTGGSTGSSTGSGSGGGTGTSGGTTSGGSTGGSTGTGGGTGSGSSQSQAMFIFGASGSFILDGKIDGDGQITKVSHHDLQTDQDGFPTQTGGYIRSIAADPKGDSYTQLIYLTPSFQLTLERRGLASTRSTATPVSCMRRREKRSRSSSTAIASRKL
jgi:hypothetical protein